MMSCVRAVAVSDGSGAVEAVGAGGGRGGRRRGGGAAAVVPAEGFERLRSEYDAILLGALGDPRVPDGRHARDILLGARFALDLYVNYRPVKLLDDRLCPLKDRGRKDVNFVVFRENTEGVYVGVGGQFKAGTTDEIAVQEEINTY